MGIPSAWILCPFVVIAIAFASFFFFLIKCIDQLQSTLGHLLINKENGTLILPFLYELYNLGNQIMDDLCEVFIYNTTLINIQKKRWTIAILKFSISYQTKVIKSINISKKKLIRHFGSLMVLLNKRI